MGLVQSVHNLVERNRRRWCSDRKGIVGEGENQGGVFWGSLLVALSLVVFFLSVSREYAETRRRGPWWVDATRLIEISVVELHDRCGWG